MNRHDDMLDALRYSFMVKPKQKPWYKRLWLWLFWQPREKVFYNWYEWQGWSFYKKAIQYKDWRSIWGHLKSKIKL